MERKPNNINGINLIVKYLEKIIHIKDYDFKIYILIKIYSN